VPAKTTKRRRKGRRERVSGGFYQVPLDWADRAAEAAGGYLILALRIHRAWRMREVGATAIAVTAKVLGRSSGHSSQDSRRIVCRLEAAGLIEVVERKSGCAARVRVIDDGLGCPTG
jgi:hypothetical protein